MGINTQYSQLSSLVSKLQQSQAPVGTMAVDDVSKEGPVSSDTQVEFSTSKDKLAYVSSHPELVNAANLTGEETSELLQSTSEKAVSAQTTCRGNKVMFDIYAVLALIQETSQEMRNSQRELRKAEVASITSSIMAQAQMQRESAITQLVVGCVSAGISAAMLGMSVKDMASSSAATKGAQKAAGLETMEQQQSLAAAEGNSAATQANLETVKAETPQSIQNEVNAKMEQAGAGKPLEGHAKAETCAKELKAAVKDADLAKGELKAAEQDVKTVEPGKDGFVEKQTKVLEARSKVNAAEAKVAEKQTALNDATEEAVSTQQEQSNARASELESVVDQYQEEFDKTTAKASKEFADTGKVSEKTQSEMKTAGQKLNYARAVQLNESAHLPSKPQTPPGQTVFARTQARVQSIREHAAPPDAHSKMQQAQLLGQSAQLVGQLGNSLGQGVAGILQAEATEKQAEQKQAEEQLDQIKDLFSNTQNVIQQSIQLFQSVTSKESQSIEEIIGGIRA